MTVKVRIDDGLLFGLIEEAHLIRDSNLTIAELLWILKTPCPAFLLARRANEVVGETIEGTKRVLIFSTFDNLSEDMLLDRGGILYSLEILDRRLEGNIRLVDVRAHARDPEPRGINFFDSEVRQWYLQKRDERVDLRPYRIIPNDHIRNYHIQLRDSLQGRAIIYLDTCHWVKIRHCVLEDEKKSEDYQRILDQLRKLKKDGTILCPLSLPLVTELIRQTSGDTLSATVKLMDELSDGVSIQAPEFLLEMEIQRYLVKLFLGENAPDLFQWAWTKVGWVAGEGIQVSSDPSEEQIQHLQNDFFSEVWKMTLEKAVRSKRAMKLPPMDAKVAEAAWFNAHAERVKKAKLKFDDILKIQRRNVFALSTFKRRFFESVEILARRFPKEARETMARLKPLEAVDPFLIPTLQISAAIQASFIHSGQKFSKNDFADAQQAAMALPYVDAFFCDRSLKHKLTTPPLLFDDAYSTVVLADPAAISNYLMKLEIR